MDLRHGFFGLKWVVDGNHQRTYVMELLCLLPPPFPSRLLRATFSLLPVTAKTISSSVSAVSGKREMDGVFCQLVCSRHMRYSVILFVSCSVKISFPVASNPVSKVQTRAFMINNVLHDKNPIFSLYTHV